MTDRITYDGDTDHLDEIVLSDVTVHIERTSQHGWYISASRASQSFHGYFTDFIVNENDFTTPRTIAGPLLGCDVEWDHCKHRCGNLTDGHRWHRCECGETR